MSACTFFGHRDCGNEIESDLYFCVEKLITENDVDTFYVGTHGNFDKMVYQVLKELKKKYTNIRCIIVFAYLPDRNEYNDFETVYPEGTEKVPKRFAVDFRNKWMIRQAEYVICYVKYNFGGAYKFAELSEKQNKHVINLYKT